MRGDMVKIKQYIKDYGIDYILEAVEKAVKQKEAEDMMMRKLKSDKKRLNEARIYEKAKEMGVRLG